MTAFVKKLLTHGFLFVLGMALFIGWDEQLATFLGFPGREVWRLLTVGWATLLFYDASRKLQKERVAARIVNTSGIQGGEEPASNWRGVGATIVRVLLFFAIVGAVGRRNAGAFIVVAVLAVTVFLVERRENDSKGRLDN
ncbi:MAG: hypothetical protein WA664_16195 [Candidatus Acidiferrales bacterium]